MADRRIWATGALALAGGAALGAGAVSIAQDGKPIGTADRLAIETVVRDYILAHPEILPQAMERLQARQSKATIDAHRAALEKPFFGAALGSAKPDVTIVEFTDYACGYCRKSVADLDRLLGQDPKLRLVTREIPILSAESATAARAALAAAKTGHYAQVHRALFAGGQLSDAKIRAVASGAMGARDPAVEAEIANNLDLARALGVEATPTFIIGDQIVSGAVGYDALRDAVAKARSRS